MVVCGVFPSRQKTPSTALNRNCLLFSCILLILQAEGAVNVRGSQLTGTANAVVDVKSLFKLKRDTNTFKNTTDKISRAVGKLL